MPEWAVLAKDIETLRGELRDALLIRRAEQGDRGNAEDRWQWIKDITEDFGQQVNKINGKIAKFNLLAPTLAQQMMPIQFSVMVEKIYDGDAWKEVRTAVAGDHESGRGRTSAASSTGGRGCVKQGRGSSSHSTNAGHKHTGLWSWLWSMIAVR